MFMRLSGVKYSQRPKSASIIVRGVALAPSRRMSLVTKESEGFAEGSGDKEAVRAPLVLVLSGDAVAAALLGALVETLGYLVQFLRPLGARSPAPPHAASVAMVDCTDPSRLSLELLHRSTMRGVSAVILGAPEAIARTRSLAREYSLTDLIVPASVDALDEPLRYAIAQAC